MQYKTSLMTFMCATDSTILSVCSLTTCTRILKRSAESTQIQRYESHKIMTCTFVYRHERQCVASTVFFLFLCLKRKKDTWPASPILSSFVNANDDDYYHHHCPHRHH